MQKPTMTIKECADAMRSYGISCSTKSVANGIASGAYPFGRVKSTGPSGRRATEIFRIDFERWLREKTANL